MNCVKKTYENIYYNSLILNHPLILFYQVNCLDYKNWLVVKKKLQRENLNFTRIKSNLFKTHFKNVSFKDVLNGPLIAVFITNRIDVSNRRNIDLGPNMFLLFSKIDKKFYSAQKTYTYVNYFSFILALKNFNKQAAHRIKQYNMSK